MRDTHTDLTAIGCHSALERDASGLAGDAELPVSVIVSGWDRLVEQYVRPLHAPHPQSASLFFL